MQNFLGVLVALGLVVVVHLIVSELHLNFGRCDGFARIKLGPIVSDIRGTVKEQCFSIWKTGVHYVRSLAGIISNPESTEQALIRNLMTLASKRWFDTLTAIQRGNWNEFAAGLEPQEGDPGGILNIIPQNRGIMSGFNAYCMAYTMVRKVGIALPVGFDDSPLGQTPPSAPVLVSTVWNTPVVDVTWTDPVTVIEGSLIRIWLRSREDIAHRQLRWYMALATLTVGLNQFRGANGAAIQFIHAPGHYLFQLDVIQPNGLKSNPSQTLEVTVT